MDSLVRRLRKQWLLLLLILPAVLSYFIFAYLPMFGVVAAFQKFDMIKGYFGSPFVGLQNFADILKSDDCRRIIGYTVAMSFVKLIIGFPAPLIFALLLNELLLKRFKRIVQTLSYLPHFLSWVIVSIIVYRVLDSNDGIITNILAWFGVSDLNILGEPKFFIPIVAISDMWKEMGFSAIFYLAALTTIDPELYEAAAVDGAKKIRQLISITLPGIAPTAVMLLIFSIGGLVSANFDQVYNLQNPLILMDTEVINTFVYRKAILGGYYSFSTAFGLAQGFVSFLLIITANYFSKKYSEVSIY